ARAAGPLGPAAFVSGRRRRRRNLTQRAQRAQRKAEVAEGTEDTERREEEKKGRRKKEEGEGDGGRSLWAGMRGCRGGVYRRPWVATTRFRPCLIVSALKLIRRPTGFLESLR